MELQLIQSKIHTLRGQRVMLDFELAVLYEIETKYLKRAVKHNISRFPPDFCFELNKEEWEHLRCNFSTSSWGGTRYLPFAFTEQGVAMLSSVLNSDHAIQTNIAIMRAFVAMRHYALTFAELSEKVLTHDKELGDIVEVLRWLGEENQARYDEIQAIQVESDPPADWDDRARIGFRKDI
jgi:ORF6N domain